mgnify:CR=1 FL=1
MGDRLKVLVVPTWYPMPEDAIGGVYHRQQTQALAEREDVEVHLLFIERRRLQRPLHYLTLPKLVTEQEQGFTVTRKRMLNLATISFDANMEHYVRALKSAYRRFEKQFGRPDVIHAHVSLPAGYACVRLSEETGIPVVLTEHASYFRRFFEGEDGEKYGRLVLEKADCFTVVSEMMRRSMPEGRTQCGIIPDMIDCSRFRLPHPERTDGEFRLVNVSGLREGKKIDDIMRAVKLLREERGMEDVRLCVIGDGYYRADYLRIRDELGLRGIVSFPGQKSREEIARILSQSDAVVIGSDVETFGIPGIEALAAGLPVISTRCGGPEEYLDEGCGALCSVGDPADMARAIATVRQHLTEYNRAYMYSVAQRYDKTAVCETMLRYFREAIAQRSAAR